MTIKAIISMIEDVEAELIELTYNGIYETEAMIKLEEARGLLEESENN